VTFEGSIACVSLTFNGFQVVGTISEGFRWLLNILCLWISVVRGIHFIKVEKEAVLWKGLVRSVRSERHNRSKLLEVPRKRSEALLEQKKQATILLGLVPV
jgi:hypothetical protein